MRGARVPVLLALPALGCGSGATGPGVGAGTASVVLLDPPGATAEAPEEPSGPFEATLDAEVEAYLSVDGDTWEPVGSQAALKLRLQTGDSATLVRQDLPARTYEHLRLILRGVATIAPGTELGGTLLDAAVAIALGSGGEVAIEKRLAPFEVRSGGAVRLTVDLNSEAWITEQNVERGFASQAELGASMRVQVETDIS